MKNILEIYMECTTTEALGPYKRYGLWLQGCDKNCEGCMSPASQEAGNGYMKTVDEIITAIITQKEIEGITVSGGEPFLQAEALENLFLKIKAIKDLGIVIFTGYYIEQLEYLAQAYPNVSAVLSMTDILIDGPYIEKLNDNNSLRGSSNQNVHFLTSRYKQLNGSYYGLPGRKFEWNISDGNMRLIGIPDKKTCELFAKTLNTNRMQDYLIKGE